MYQYFTQAPAVPFCSDDKETAISLQLLLEDLYEVETLFREGQQGQKLSATAQKKMDHEVAKAIQEATISQFSLLSSEGKEKINATRNPKRLKTYLGEKQSHGSLRSTFDSMWKVLEQCQSVAAEELALKKELLQEQMLLKNHKLKLS
jgi:hypothetical protein